VLLLSAVWIAPAQAASGSPDVPSQRALELYAKHEQVCEQRGWHKFTLTVDGRERQLFWKGPPGAWTHGAIIAFHGGGGMDSNYCSTAILGQPMVDFADQALAQGFAVFSPNAARGVLKDAKGNSCGKRWNCVTQPHEQGTSLDLAFIRTLLTQAIPALRPPGSATDLFVTGVSNGGFMTVLVGTQFPGLISAFAPVSAGDPYGTHMDCGPGPLASIRKSAPGSFHDNETGRSVAKRDACSATAYPHEQPWPEAAGPKPPFKLFYHEGDAGVDLSCKHKLRQLLITHGYPDDGSFIITDRGRRTIPKHFWVAPYNKPILEFFSRSARARQ